MSDNFYSNRDSSTGHFQDVDSDLQRRADVSTHMSRSDAELATLEQRNRDAMMQGMMNAGQNNNIGGGAGISPRVVKNFFMGIAVLVAGVFVVAYVADWWEHRQAQARYAEKRQSLTAEIKSRVGDDTFRRFEAAMKVFPHTGRDLYLKSTLNLNQFSRGPLHSLWQAYSIAFTPMTGMDGVDPQMQDAQKRSALSREFPALVHESSSPVRQAAAFACLANSACRQATVRNDPGGDIPKAAMRWWSNAKDNLDANARVILCEAAGESLIFAAYEGYPGLTLEGAVGKATACGGEMASKAQMALKAYQAGK